LIRGSSSVSLSGFSVDWEKAFYQGQVTAVNDDFFDLEIPEEYPYEIIDNKLFLRNQPLWGIGEIDPERRGLRFQRRLNLGCDNLSVLKVGELSGNKVRFEGEICKSGSVRGIEVLHIF
jgi:hypothetical protein